MTTKKKKEGMRRRRMTMTTKKKRGVRRRMWTVSTAKYLASRCVHEPTTKTSDSKATLQ